MATDRKPPHDEKAERALLGALMVESLRLVPVALSSYRMTPEVFYVRAHQMVFDAIVRTVMEKKKPADLVTVSAALGGMHQLEEIGGDLFLVDLVDSCPTADHAEHYMDMVRQKWVLREIVKKARGHIEQAYEANRGDSLLKAVSNDYMTIESEEPSKSTNAEIMAANLDQWRRAHAGEHVAGLALPAQWKRLGKLTGGLENGVTILGAYPSQGKTSMANDIALTVAQDGGHVAYSLIDDENEDILKRFQARRAGVSLPKLTFGYAGEANLQKVEDATAVLNTYAIELNDRDRNLYSLCAWVRYRHLRKPLDLYILDYIQNVSTGNVHLDQNENAKLTYVMQTLKAVSLELRVPFLILSQFSRTGRSENRRPRMSDLRGSGALEQDAKKIILLHKNVELPEENNRTPVWVMVEKNKNGQTGNIEFWFRRNYFRFDEAPPDWDEEGERESMDDMELAFEAQA